jgi:transposase
MQRQSNKLNFEGQNIYIGIDVHKKSWTVSIMTKDLEHKTFSQSPSAKDLAVYLSRNFPGARYYSAYEAGFCGFHIHYDLMHYRIHNIVVNAADIPTSHKDRDGKTDPRDSRKIARSLRGGELTAIHVPSRKTMEDRTLMRTRQALIKDLTRTKIRTKALLNFYGIEHPEVFSQPTTHWSRRYITWLKSIPMEHESGKTSLDLFISEVEAFRTPLLDVNRKIRQLSQSEAYKNDFELLKTVPGIALITGMTMLTEIEDINRFRNTNHFASYVGLVPSCHSSGENSLTGEMTSRTHKYMLSMLIESSRTAARYDPALLLSYSNLCRRMEPNKALIRIARKILNRIYYMLKTKTKYVCGVDK